MVVGQTTEVARLSTNIAVHVYHLDNIERDYLINSTSPALADTVEVERTASKLRVLRELLGDDAQQVARADDVINGWMRWRSEMDPLLEQRRNGFDVVPTLQRGGGAPSVTGMAAELGSIANRAREQRAANYSRMGITIASLLGSLTLGFAALAVIFALRGHKQISYLPAPRPRPGNRAQRRPTRCICKTRLPMRRAGSRTCFLKRTTLPPWRSPCWRWSGNGPVRWPGPCTSPPNMRAIAASPSLAPSPATCPPPVMPPAMPRAVPPGQAG